LTRKGYFAQRQTPNPDFFDSNILQAILWGRLDRKATTATRYAWLFGKKDVIGPPYLMWVAKR
jgi:hypothetical protein